MLIGLIACASSASADTLEVGPGKAFTSLSAAVAAVQDGDRIVLSPGDYFECAIVTHNNVTLEGADGTATLTDKTCQGKAILVIAADNVTVRNLTLSRARVPDGNGAGIRAEGVNLTVDNVRFIDNQEGLLAGNNPASTILVKNSEFRGNGICNPDCSHAIYVNNLTLLRVEGSTFEDTHQGHHIKSRAARTEIVNNTITDGPQGTASYLIDIPNGGALVVSGNTLSKGPKAENHSAAISIGAEGVTNPTPEVIIEGNTFENAGDYDTIFVNNVSATRASLKTNTFKGRVLPLKGDGNVDGQAPATELPGLKTQAKEFLRSAVTLADSFRILILVGIGAGVVGGFLSLILITIFLLRPSLLMKMIARRMK